MVSDVVGIADLELLLRCPVGRERGARLFAIFARHPRITLFLPHSLPSLSSPLKYTKRMIFDIAEAPSRVVAAAGPPWPRQSRFGVRGLEWQPTLGRTRSPQNPPATRPEFTSNYYYFGKLLEKGRRGLGRCVRRGCFA